MLAIARQKAPRLASIERCKLFRQQPPRPRLVIVWVGDEMDLDTLLVAAHWHAHARRQRLRGVHCLEHSLRANVKSSMMHHSLEQNVGPATTSSVWQPARKTGKQASDCWMLPWSMHALSCGTRGGARAVKRVHMQRIWAGVTSQSVGSLPVVSWCRFAQRDTAACLAPGAFCSSLHEWLMKAVTSPIAAGTVLAASSVALVLVDLPQAPSRGSAPSPAGARSAAISRLAGRHRRSFEARSSTASGSLPPTSAATAAASSASVPRPPRRPRWRWRRPRLRGVARAAHRRQVALKTAFAQ
eukprot:scaffold7499_cov65-Phaeocystis_antarctica.AAC.3